MTMMLSELLCSEASPAPMHERGPCVQRGYGVCRGVEGGD